MKGEREIFFFFFLPSIFTRTSKLSLIKMKKIKKKKKQVDSIGSARGGSGGGDSEVQRTMLEVIFYPFF